MFTNDILYFIPLLLLIMGLGLLLFYLKFEKFRKQLFILVTGFGLGTIANILVLTVLWSLPIDFPWKSSLYFSPIVPGTLYLLFFHFLSRFQHYAYSRSIAAVMALFIYAVLSNELIYYLLILLPADLIDNFIIH